MSEKIEDPRVLPSVNRPRMKILVYTNSRVVCLLHTDGKYYRCVPKMIEWVEE